MFRGFYTAASGMLTQQRRTEMLTNNMANTNTPGFKADQAVLRAFPEMLLQRIEKKTIPAENNIHTLASNEIGSINTGVYIQEVVPLFQQGDIKETGLKTDLALTDTLTPANGVPGEQGAAFLTLMDPQGEARYTRNGNFTIDGHGFLTTASGMFVLDNSGNRIQLVNDQFTVSENGVLTGSDGESVQLGISYAENPMRLIKEGDGLFRTENGEALPNAALGQFNLKQGFLERSNVDAGRTMTEIMTAYRAFEANQKVLQAYDRSMEKAANEIGRIG